MASSAILLRRALRALSSFHRPFSASSSIPIPRPLSSATPPPPPRPHSPNFPLQFQSRSFKSSSVSLLSTRSSPSNIPEEIGPDTILFEGCDYNHWLFVMDFPKDNKPSPEEMVRTYEETCAKGLNISVEEAKKKIYACSTTTYTGFQAVMTEEESKKFEGLPGVIFVLPDSYIDPVNKQYGGDQYINGTIIPRPPPVQFGRNPVRRDRNGGRGQYNQQDNSMTRPQGNPSYNNRRPMQGDGRNYGPSPNYPPQQNFGQASQNYPPQQNYNQGSQIYPPRQSYDQTPQNYPPQQSYGQTPQNYGQTPPNYPPQQNYGPPQPNSGQAPQNYPPQQNQASQNYPQQQTYGAASQQRYGPASPQYAQQQSFGPPGQGERRNFAPQQNFELPGQGERDPMPRHGGTGASEAWNGNFTPSYVKDFKPSYMEEFEQAEQGNYPSKEQSGSQQRYPPPGPGNFTGEGRY